MSMGLQRISSTSYILSPDPLERTRVLEMIWRVLRLYFGDPETSTERGSLRREILTLNTTILRRDWRYVDPG
jgi:RNase P/RNase MRP subunit POP5